MTSATAAHLVLLLPIALVSLILPWFGHSRRGVLFGVTVSLDFANSPQARTALRSYQRAVFLLALIVIASIAADLWLLPSDAHTLIPALALLLELVLAYLLWRRGSARIKPHAIAVPLERHADLAPTSTVAPILLTALSLLPLAATALWLRLHWLQIPARWPQHWNANGIADAWATRSLSSVFDPLLAGVIVLLILLATALFLSRAPGAQTTQRRRALYPLAALSWIVAGMLCFVASLPVTHFAFTHVALIDALYLTITMAAAFWMMWRSGLAPHSNTTEPYDSTPDARWYGGIFYYNPSDAAILVPKRFGWGWTFNFARPASWIFLVALIALALSIKLLK
ncbi:MAG: DUF5808 domain-containing protein [Acidobacteriaceae bacterium]